MSSARLTYVFLPLTAIALGVAGWLNFTAPLEATEGIVQKTMYIHVPAAWSSYLALFVGTVAAIGFLKNRKRSWDRVAHASIEIGAVFCTAVLLTGPVWAKAVWSV